MSTSRRAEVRASRRPGLAVGAVLGAAALGLGLGLSWDRQRAGTPNPDAQPPAITQRGQIVVRLAHEGPERILFRPYPGGARAQLLWLEGRVVAASGDGGGFVTGSGGELLRVSDRMQPSALPVALGGRGLLTIAVAPGGGLWATDDAGQVLEIDRAGRIVAEATGPFHYPAVATDPAVGQPWFVRSSGRFVWSLPAPGAPVVVGRPASGQADSLGQARIPSHALLADLANAGHLAVLGDRLFFAPFIRDELVAMSHEGDTLWIASRGLPQSTEEPAFELQEGRAVIDYHPVNLGLVVGPNRHLYLLSTPGFTMTETRLDEFDPATGELLRTGHLPTALPTLAADRQGRVYLVDPARLAATLPPDSREPFREFDLPSGDDRRLRLADLRGQVTLVNFWASWCAPCRREMPALDALARELEPHGLHLVGLNDDDSPGRAGAFLAEVGLDMATGLGGGDLRRQYGLPGLPVTMLIDRDLRIAARWIGELTAAQLG
ncbi:MAG: TlpA disulfide reductase family protein, partial [Gemmatimonadota bacterium]|nr:TlpA disulfide reductase family protein [Gemmatimonadota bacterium]